MKHFKRLLAISLALLLLFGLAACGEEKDVPRTPVPVAYDGAQITIALSGTAADYGLLKLLDNETYRISASDSFGDSMSSDLSVVPLWFAAEQIAAGKDLRIVAVNSFGLLSVVASDSGIQGVKALDGKTVYAGSAYPANADAVSGTFDFSEKAMRELFSKYGVTAAAEYRETVSLYEEVLAGKTQIAVLPEPYASLAAVKSNAQFAFTLTDAWTDAGEKVPFVESCIVAKASFVENNADGLRRFLADLRASVEWVNLHPVDAVNLLIEKEMADADILTVDSQLSEKKQEAAKQQQAIDLISRSNPVVIDGEDMKAPIALQSYAYDIPDEAIFILK